MSPKVQASELGGTLEALMEIAGVLACMVATEEGLPLVARLRTELDEDGLAAAAAVLGQLGSRALAGMEHAQVQLVVLDASKLRFMVQPVALGYLMVVTEPSAQADPVAEQMNSAAAGLGRASTGLTAQQAA